MSPWHYAWFSVGGHGHPNGKINYNHHCQTELTFLKQILVRSCWIFTTVCLRDTIMRNINRYFFGDSTVLIKWGSLQLIRNYILKAVWEPGNQYPVVILFVINSVFCSIAEVPKYPQKKEANQKGLRVLKDIFHITKKSQRVGGDAAAEVFLLPQRHHPHQEIWRCWRRKCTTGELQEQDVVILTVTRLRPQEERTAGVSTSGKSQIGSFMSPHMRWLFAAWGCDTVTPALPLCRAQTKITFSLTRV